MDLSQIVNESLQNANGPLGPGFLQSLGLPQGAKLETADWIYYDTVRVRLTKLGDINFQTQLFTKDAQGFARNLKFPLTSDLAFVHGNATCFANFEFNQELTTANPLFGPMLPTVAFDFLSATKLTGQVSNKNYMNDNLLPWTNFEMPAIVQPLQGQATSVPFAQFAPTYQQHHRVNKPISPVIVWPASSTVLLSVETQVRTWWSQVISGVDGENPVDITKHPWDTEIAVTLQFQFPGCQVRVVK